jgi:hypothetical protein
MLYKYDIDVLLPKLHGPIKEIVDEELKKGNQIVEVASSWPMPKVNVWFQHTITNKYESKYPNLKYSLLNDPKNWYEEYLDIENGFMVAVKSY